MTLQKRQYQELDKVYEFDKIESDKNPIVKKYNKLDLIYDSIHDFYEYNNIKKFKNLSCKSKYSFLDGFFNDLNKFS